MLRCTLLDDYQNCALALADWARLPDVSVEAITDHIAAPEALARRLARSDIVVAMRERTRFDAEFFALLPNLRLLITTGARNAAIDLAAAAANGVTVSGTRILAHPAPELTWGLLLALARHIPAEVSAFRAGEKWQTRIGMGLAGKTLGIVGLGKIGTRIARYGQAFEMRTIAWSPNMTDDRARAAGTERMASLDALLAASDVVTLHMVLSARTRGLLGARELGLMRPSALLLNTSRGPLIDEGALIDALKKRRIAGAGLDVFDVEPLPLAHPLRRLPNVVATPHVGYVTEENYRNFYADAVENIQAWIDGAPIRTLSAAP